MNSRVQLQEEQKYEFVVKIIKFTSVDFYFHPDF